MNIWIVSDGGLANTSGYYGWVIASDTDILHEGKGRVPSNPSQIDSLRTESMGMYYAILIMRSLLYKYHLTQEINLASDNSELIKRTKHYYKYGYNDNKTPHAPHSDIQSEINFMLTDTFPHLNILHVRCHQDAKKKSNLTWVEILNVR